MTEREAMMLEKWRELRGHVAGMQCAIDNCGINKDEWNEAAKYAMDNMGEWKRLLSEYADYLSRATDPVTYMLVAPGCVCGPTEAQFDIALHKAAQTMPPGTAVVPLYTHPPEPARDAKDAARYRWLAEHEDADLYMENPGKEQLDRAIDAAMAQESGE